MECENVDVDALLRSWRRGGMAGGWVSVVLKIRLIYNESNNYSFNVLLAIRAKGELSGIDLGFY